MMTKKFQMEGIEVTAEKAKRNSDFSIKIWYKFHRSKSKYDLQNLV